MLPVFIPPDPQMFVTIVWFVVSFNRILPHKLVLNKHQTPGKMFTNPCMQINSRFLLFILKCGNNLESNMTLTISGSRHPPPSNPTKNGETNIFRGTPDMKIFCSKGKMCWDRRDWDRLLTHNRNIFFWIWIYLDVRSSRPSYGISDKWIDLSWYVL